MNITYKISLSLSKNLEKRMLGIDLVVDDNFMVEGN